MDNYSEPIFDDTQLALFEDQETEQLVNELVECIIFLRNTAAALRTEVNDYAQELNPKAPPRYYEVYSDLCRSFEDDPAYLRFEKQLSRLIYE